MPCSGNGPCKNGRCVCNEGYSGEDCSELTKQCPNGCSKNGICTPNGCKCFEGYRGTSCDIVGCKRNCTTHGTCVHNSQCVCDRGYAGLDCNTTFVCNPMNCSGHGVCNGPMKCACEEGWIGNDCSISLCGDSCDLLHGKCRANRMCECKQGWGGQTVLAEACLGLGCAPDAVCARKANAFAMHH